jgi:SNF2 family DNA or RNA helicase
MDNLEEHSVKERILPIARLTEYLHAVSGMRGTETISVNTLLPELEEITKRQLAQDLESLGFSSVQPFARLELAEVLQEQLRKVQASHRKIDLTLPPLPSPAEFLNNLRGQVDETHARRAPVIEAAYDYAEQEPSLFLLGHGMFRTRAVSPGDKTVIAYRHQVEEARRIVERYSGNVMAVHEVGLGKTITAILVLCELLAREPDLTTLILVPTNLKHQWEQELARCVDLPITTGASAQDILTGRLLLLSIDTAKEKHRAQLLSQRHWGLLIVDEGHLLRHEQTSRYSFVYSLHTRRHLLLTATPVHNSPYDIYHLANIIRPGTLGQKEAFAEAHLFGERQLLKPAVLQERLQHIVSQQRREETGLTFPHRTLHEISVKTRSDIEHELYDDVLQILRGIYRRHLGSVSYVRLPSGLEQGVSQLVLVSILVLRELASHPLAALKTISGPLLGKVESFAKAARDPTDLDSLQKFLKKYSKVTWKTGIHKKTDALLERLPGLVDKYGRVIIYVEFRETQKLLVGKLLKKEVDLPAKTDIIPYHGGLPIAEKARQIQRFEQHDRACFISTDAGGQGLNLQKGNVVVNFDFPWNPMRVEQRIGRVDRLEQTASQVLIENFITVDTIEQYVYQILQKKLRVCQDVMGHVLPVIFRLRMQGIHFYSEADVLGIGQTILSSRDQEDLRQRFLALGQTIEEQAKASEEKWKLPRSWIDE